MKSLILGLLLLSSSASFAGANYTANDCEIFVDKVLTTLGSHTYLQLFFYVKVLPSRLDGAIQEVGFWAKADGYGGGSSMSHGWKPIKLTPFFGASDYFTLDLAISSDFGGLKYEGLFYVRTNRGTTYWLKSKSGGNLFPSDLVRTLMNRRTTPIYQNRIEDAYPTQNFPELQDYNPGRCY